METILTKSKTDIECKISISNKQYKDFINEVVDSLLDEYSPEIFERAELSETRIRKIFLADKHYYDAFKKEIVKKIKSYVDDIMTDPYEYDFEVIALEKSPTLSLVFEQLDEAQAEISHEEEIVRSSNIDYMLAEAKALLKSNGYEVNKKTKK